MLCRKNGFVLRKLRTTENRQVSIFGLRLLNNNGYCHGARVDIILECGTRVKQRGIGEMFCVQYGNSKHVSIYEVLYLFNLKSRKN